MWRWFFRNDSLAFRLSISDRKEEYEAGCQCIETDEEGPWCQDWKWHSDLSYLPYCVLPLDGSVPVKFCPGAHVAALAISIYVTTHSDVCNKSKGKYYQRSFFFLEVYRIIFPLFSAFYSKSLPIISTMVTCNSKFKS